MSCPQVGRRVRLHYAERKRPNHPFHGEFGAVTIRSFGRPRNHLIKLDGGRLVVVPAGNLYPEDGQ